MKARVAVIRTNRWLAPRLWLALGVLAAAAFVTSRPAVAQEEAALGLASAEELQEIVGPIALYPDDLVAIVLPASTYPLQVVQAARFLEDRANDSSLQPNEEWDDSIVALLNYPEVVALLNDDLDWTYDLGTAVLNQRADVLSAIQDFRDVAYAAGNLRSDERQTVASEDDTIEIKPADPKVIYIPYYEPERVVVYQPEPVYYYYPRPYPVYYYPYPAHYHFNTGFFWGVNTWFSIGWHSHYVHAYDPFYYGHPYYGHSYYNPFYVRNVYVNHYHRYPNYVWEPRYRSGGRPFVRGSEGRVQTADRAPPRTPSTDRLPRRGVLDSNAAATRTREGSANRTTAGTATRATEGAATSSRAANGTPQPRRGVTSSGYRSRSAESAQPHAAAEGAQAARPTRASPNAQAQARAPGAAAETSNAPATTYRSGGGMAQARNRSGAQQSSEARTSPSARTNPGVSPRAIERSTGMPRESSRVAPAQRDAAPSASRPPAAAAPSVSAPRHGGGGGGGGASAQRSEPAGSYRGNSGGNEGGGGSQRSGGSHPAARHSEGRSAGR